VLVNVYEPLVAFSPEMRLTPVLATSWTNPTDRAWRFELRRGVRFHDGRPLTARDVQYTIERGLSLPQAWVRSWIPLVEKAQALDDHTVEILTRAPAPLLLNQLAAVPILPSGAAPAERAVGTGPYRVTEWAAERELVLGAFPGYWSGRPRWRRAVFRAEPDGRARVGAVLRGEADVAAHPPEAELPRALAEGRARLAQHPALSVSILGFLVRPGRDNPLADARVRESIALAVDRRALIREVLGGRAAPATQLAPPDVFGYVPEIRYLEADLDAARAALARTPFARGFSAPLYCSSRTRPIADFVESEARRIGVRFELREQENFDSVLLPQQAPAFVLDITFPNLDSADLLFDGFHTKDDARGFGQLNFSGYSEPEMDRLLERSHQELDSRRRYQLLKRAMEVAVASRALIPLCVRSHLFVVGPGLAWPKGRAGRLVLEEIQAAE
jgi:peptide/nickel transport system substrate-binding protein